MRLGRRTAPLMSRYFTLTEAEAMLPAVEQSVRQAQALQSRLAEAETVMRSHNRKIAMSGGALVNLNRVHAMRDQSASAARQLKRTIEWLMSAGCQVKDLAEGLVDFPALYRGEEVLLCWRLGESKIGYWHGLTEGFAGRKEIDEDFRRGHSGGT